jgi:predicted Zn-dependent peptidase
MEFYGLGLDYLQTYSDRIRGITVEDVQAAARKYLSADEIAVVVAGPNGAA